MKDIYKQPIFYYVLVPIVVAIWPLWLFAVGLPSAEAKLQKEMKKYDDAEKLIEQILTLDPQRLDYAKANEGSSDFDYTTAIDQISGQCKISPSGYKLSSSPIRRMKGGQKSQDATMTIESIDIQKFAKFLSLMHMRWQNLQSTNLSVTKQKGQKDIWKVDLRMKYYQ